KATDREVPRGGLPADVGVLVMNVTTVSALGKFIATGMPLTTKRLTIDGSAIRSGKNVEVILGTPIADVLSFCDLDTDAVAKVIMGGPMMGTAVLDTHFPIIKQNNAILAFDAKQAALAQSGPCIRCGRCISACPMGLSPVEQDIAYQQGDVAMLNTLMTDLCIGCGVCSFVCPAKRPLAQTIALAKIMQKNGGK
ncbi:MAG: 4Fe-4S dicluster-binding protein, partial [Ruthenibacterium sp.]